jgi:chromosome segregation ATPase
MKLANPLRYPLAVLVGGLTLVVGVRLVRLPSVVVLPGAAAIATLGATALKSRQPNTPPALENPHLERELQKTRQQALSLTQQATALQSEAQRLLTEPHQLELLGTVQYGCDRTHELPAQVDLLAQRLQGKDSLLSIADLERQLAEAEQRRHSSSGAARQQCEALIASLQRNLKLAKQGKDAREAQVISLSILIQDMAGVLQQLQNTLRTADLGSSGAADEVRNLSQELSSMQENMKVLIEG